MTFISCYIDNYGKLSDFKHEFKPGVNFLFQENGWGKTTFASFLKAMLFGLDHSTSKKNIVDRVRYLPWNGGNFGGSLTFYYNDTTYKVERTFGKTPKDDKCTLYDLSTNTVCEHFSPTFAEEIFHVDRNSFEKTAFLTLGSNQLLTDIIASRLGDISEQEADLEASTDAIIKLEKLSNTLKGQRKGVGTIPKLENEQVELTAAISASKRALDQIEGLTAQLQKKFDEQSALETEISTSEEHSLLAVKYEKLSEDLAQAKQAFLEIDDFFRSEKPNDQLLSQIEIFVKTYHLLNAKIEEMTPSPQKMRLYESADQFFKQGVPEPQIIEEIHSKLDKIHTLSQGQNSMSDSERDELTSLQPRYEQISLAKISACDKAYNRVDDLTFEENRLQTEYKHKTLPAVFFCWLIAILSGFVYVFGDSLMNEIRLATGLFGAMFAILAVFFIFRELKIAKDNKQTKELLEAILYEKDEKYHEYTSFLSQFPPSNQSIPSQLDILREELARYQFLLQQKQWCEDKNTSSKEEIAFLQEELDRFFTNYFPEGTRQNHQQCLSTIQKNLAFLQSFSTVLGDRNDAIRENTLLEDKINKFFSLYPLSFPQNYDNALGEIKTNLVLHSEKEKFYQQTAQSLATFEQENPDFISQQRSTHETHAPLRERAKALVSEIATLANELEHLYLEADKMVDLTSELAKNRQELATMCEKHAQLTVAITCLYEAKEALAKRYLSKMERSFSTIVSHLNLNRDLHINTKLEVQAEENGYRRPTSSLSAGEQDLIQFATRLALVEAVYQVPPPLILDDPFCHLDETSIVQANQLLEKLSCRYQIIHLVCHNSRKSMQF